MFTSNSLRHARRTLPPSLLGVPVYACVARSSAPCTLGISERALKRCPLGRIACFAELGGKCDQTLIFKMDSN